MLKTNVFPEPPVQTCRMRSSSLLSTAKIAESTSLPVYQSLLIIENVKIYLLLLLLSWLIIIQL